LNQSFESMGKRDLLAIIGEAERIAEAALSGEPSGKEETDGDQRRNQLGRDPGDQRSPLMLRRVDLWVGRHMSATRWMFVWWVVTISGLVVWVGGGWWIVLGIPMTFCGVFGVYGNARRRRRAKGEE